MIAPAQIIDIQTPSKSIIDVDIDSSIKDIPVPSLHLSHTKAVVDELIAISVKDLPVNAPVTVSSHIMNKGVLYIGYGHFYSNEKGEVNVHEMASLGGTYMGKKKMGLITSMIPMTNKNFGSRFLPSQADAFTPYVISAWKGFINCDLMYHLVLQDYAAGIHFDGLEHFGEKRFDEHLIAQQTVERTYLDESVKRVPVKVEHNGVKIRGTMFIPKGQAPFPGIIDLFGGHGGCVETRAALLAKHGFITFALAYFGFKDLEAKSLLDFEMHYFKEATDWFCQHPQVRKGGIGMSGVCMGSQCALLMAIREPRIKASVMINTSVYTVCDPNFWGNPMRDTTPEHVEPDTYPVDTNIHHIIDGRWSRPGHKTEFMLKLPKWQSTFDNPMLFLVGDQDTRCANDVIVPKLMQHLNECGRSNVSVKTIHGQGHLIEPPYAPMCTESRDGASFSAATEKVLAETSPGLLLVNNFISNWGGNRKSHEETSILAWETLVNHFKENLMYVPKM